MMPLIIFSDISTKYFGSIFSDQYSLFWSLVISELDLTAQLRTLKIMFFWWAENKCYADYSYVTFGTEISCRYLPLIIHNSSAHRAVRFCENSWNKWIFRYSAISRIFIRNGSKWEFSTWVQHFDPQLGNLIFNLLTTVLCLLSFSFICFYKHNNFSLTNLPPPHTHTKNKNRFLKMSIYKNKISY